jgi:GTP-binding protein
MKTNIPKVVIIGRPNVGKSMLVNRICNRSEAIVYKEPMITRDRKYYKTDWEGRDFYILDTGGIDIKSKNRLFPQIFNQAKKAMEESDLIIFMVDIKEPLSTIDEDIADILRKSNKPYIFIGNKWDDQKGNYYVEDYLKLGFDYPITVSAMHGLNITELLDEIIYKLSKIDKGNEVVGTESDGKKRIPSISILGQPNVGKSTLFNNIIKEDRVIVDEVEGTTRDSIDSIISIDKNSYRFIDTAGLKKNRLREEDLEFYSKIRTLKTIEKSDICLVLIDATKDITNQDQRIVQTCLEKGASAFVLFNKTDLISQEKIEGLIREFGNKFDYARFIPFLKISALKNIGIKAVFNMIEQMLIERLKKIPDRKLIELFKELEKRSSIYSKGKKFRIKFIKQIKTSPPAFLIFSNMDIRGKNNIKRFIEFNIRDNFGFIGAPIFFKFKF